MKDYLDAFDPRRGIGQIADGEPAGESHDDDGKAELHAWPGATANEAEAMHQHRDAVEDDEFWDNFPV